jgi:hypothetical protein
MIERDAIWQSAYAVEKEGRTMFAVVVREAGDQPRIDGSGDHVSQNVAPRLRETPGFVSALWMSDQGGGTLNVLVFETEDQARAGLEGARQAPRPPFLRLERADIYRVLASS